MQISRSPSKPHHLSLLLFHNQGSLLRVICGPVFETTEWIQTAFVCKSIENHLVGTSPFDPKVSHDFLNITCSSVRISRVQDTKKMIAPLGIKAWLQKDTADLFDDEISLKLVLQGSVAVGLMGRTLMF